MTVAEMSEKERMNIEEATRDLNTLREDDIQIVFNYIRFKKLIEGIGYEVRKKSIS